MPRFKQHETKLIFDYVTANAPKNSTIVDIGCRKGKWILPFVNHMPTCNFHCFEALLEHFERTVHRFQKKPNVNVYHSVMSNVEGTVLFYKDLQRAGWSSMRKHQFTDMYEEISTPSSTLDQYKLSPYFLKIDVEGAEYLVLQGAESTLKNTEVIYFECNEVHFKHFDYTAKDMYDFLIRQNFTLHTTDLKEITLQEFEYFTKEERRGEIGRHSNYVALKNHN